jgi:hypothetical protein
MTTTLVVAYGRIVKIHSWNNSKSSHNAPKDNIKWCLKTTLIFYKNYIKKCNVTSNVAPRQHQVAPKGFVGWHLVLLGLTQWTNQVCPKTSLACPNPKTSQPGPQGKLGNQTPICQVLNFPRHHGDPNVSLTLHANWTRTKGLVTNLLPLSLILRCQQRANNLLVGYVVVLPPKKTPNFLVKVYPIILLQ